jgi:hypothetical protein
MATIAVAPIHAIIHALDTMRRATSGDRNTVIYDLLTAVHGVGNASMFEGTS